MSDFWMRLTLSGDDAAITQGEDLGYVSGMHLVAVPDEDLTKEHVLHYAKRGVLLVPASVVHLAERDAPKAKSASKDGARL